jgi:peptidyl-prolyl cis-trans isomerase-like 1
VSSVNQRPPIFSASVLLQQKKAVAAIGWEPPFLLRNVCDTSDFCALLPHANSNDVVSVLCAKRVSRKKKEEKKGEFSYMSTLCSSNNTTSSLAVTETMVRVVTLHTTAGNISVELYDGYAPRLCQNFFDLASHGKYDNTLVHKLVPGQFLQGGGAPGGSGGGGEAFERVFIDDELHPALRHTGAGVVSFANAGPDLNASQFLISLCPQPKWDGVYSIIGRISSGMRILETLSTQWEVDAVSFKPYNPIRITSCSSGTYPRQRRPSSSVHGADLPRANTTLTGKRPRDDVADDNKHTRVLEGCVTLLEPSTKPCGVTGGHGKRRDAVTSLLSLTSPP